MTKKESAEKIVEQRGCCIGIYCSDCPLHGVDCGTENFSDESKLRRNLAQAYLNSLEFELPPGHPWADEKPTTEETEHPSELEIQKRATVFLDHRPAYTQANANEARSLAKDILSVELLWDIRELLKNSLDQSYCVEQAINNAGR